MASFINDQNIYGGAHGNYGGGAPNNPENRHVPGAGLGKADAHAINAQIDAQKKADLFGPNAN